MYALDGSLLKLTRWQSTTGTQIPTLCKLYELHKQWAHNPFSTGASRTLTRLYWVTAQRQ